MAFSLLSFNSNAQCNNGDWFGLKFFYSATDGNNWFDNSGWDNLIAPHAVPPENCDLSELYGVTLDQNTKRVVKLDIRNNNINGTLPSDLWLLTQLEHLLLNGDYPGERTITGTIPPELGRLSNLKTLRLQTTGLTGNIPKELGNLSNLTELTLNVNTKLTGNIPPELGNLIKLKILHLHATEITGSIPSELGNLSELTRLDLFNNKLTGNIPPELGQLNKLATLQLQCNQLTGSIPPELANLSNLKTLALSSNQLSGCFHNTLSKFCFGGTTIALTGIQGIQNNNNFDASWDDFCENGSGMCPIASCTGDIVITKNTPFQNLYESNGTISTLGNVIIQQNEEVEYKANKKITLNGGFIAEDTKFDAVTGPCN